MCNPAGAPCGHQPALLGTGQLSPCHHWRLHSKIIHCAVYVLRATAATLMCRTPNCSKACEPSAPTTDFSASSTMCGPGSSRHNNGLSATAAQTLLLLLLCCAAAPRLQRRRRCRCATAAASQVRFLLLLLSRCCPSCCCAAACTAPHALRDCAAAAQALHSCIFAAAPLPPLLSQPLLPLC